MARIAGVAHGVVTRAQLLRAGVTPAEIEQRLRTGALIREHRGVYRVGHRAPSLEARYLAAVWACGEQALLSGRRGSATSSASCRGAGAGAGGDGADEAARRGRHTRRARPLGPSRTRRPGARSR